MEELAQHRVRCVVRNRGVVDVAMVETECLRELGAPELDRIGATSSVPRADESAGLDRLSRAETEHLIAVGEARRVQNARRGRECDPKAENACQQKLPDFHACSPEMEGASSRYASPDLL